MSSSVSVNKPPLTPTIVAVLSEHIVRRDKITSEKPFMSGWYERSAGITYWQNFKALNAEATSTLELSGIYGTGNFQLNFLQRNMKRCLEFKMIPSES
jgi:hypothetical protein